MDQRRPVPVFDREFFDGTETFTRIGDGELGGKASGLWFARELLAAGLGPGASSRFQVGIPRLVVLTTEVFDAFIARNRLAGLAASSASDREIANAFQQADLPTEVVGHLRALIARVTTPLAVRSSSLLEDALYQPFAGVYATKMIPNNQPDVDTRFRRLVEAIKLVYASTYFHGARSYLKSTGHRECDEKMAVILQEVVGLRHGDRFYPDLSAVARSWNFYPTGHARPQDGVVTLALGLGRTIVDGGRAWSYSPAWPRAVPPFGSARDLLRQTQATFWSVNMGRPPEYDPINEAEYLVEGDLGDAETDDALKYLASTYDHEGDRIELGMPFRGPRVLNFASLLDLEDYPLNDLMRRLLELCEKALDAKVEIEMAATFPADRSAPARLGFLQVRPMAVSDQEVDLDAARMQGERVLASSTRVLGNGVSETLRDVVYVPPEAFSILHTREIVDQLDAINRALVERGRTYLLIGFGRWGSSDPSLGIPVEWGHISNARAVVEAALPGFYVDPSQGSHFFHNITSFRVPYFTLLPDGPGQVDWTWLARQRTVREAPRVRHVELDHALRVEVDGRSGRGLILHP